MGNSKKKQTINNINNLNLEIDYDKLADSIVKALNKNSSQANEPASEKKIKFREAVKKIIKGEASKDGRYLSAPFSLIVSLIYRTISIVGLVFLIILNISTIISLVNISWTGWQILANIIFIIIIIVVSVTILLYLLVLWGAANDVEKETDKNYIINVFTGIISLTALVVSIIAINKGIG